MAGGAVSVTRDRKLADRLLKIVRLCAKRTGKVLVCVDGWAAYPKAIKRAFRDKDKVVGPGQPQRGRPRLALWPQLAIGVVIKYKRAYKLVEVRREIVAGSRELVAELVSTSQGGLYLNTSYIERFNGTLREPVRHFNAQMSSRRARLRSFGDRHVCGRERLQLLGGASGIASGEL